MDDPKTYLGLVAVAVVVAGNTTGIDSRSGPRHRHLVVPLVHAHRLASFAIAIMTFTSENNLGHSRIADSYAL